MTEQAARQGRSILAAWSILLLAAFVCAPGHAEEGETAGGAQDIAVAYSGRIAGDTSSTRLFLDFDKKLEFTSFFIENPARLVIEGPPVLFRFADADAFGASGLVEAARYGAISSTRSRIVLTLAGPAKASRFEMVEIDPGSRYRLVADLVPVEPDEFRQAIAAQQILTGRSGNAAAKGDRVRAGPKSPDTFTVVIDPGHGGIDGGAKGAGGALEKDLTLAAAKLLQAEIPKLGPFEVKLTRESDVFLSLHERVAFARRHRADLAIAVHADSVRQKFVRGATVYTLSKSASDELAGELAHSENMADLVAGLELPAADDAVTDILADLTARETSGFSRIFASTLVGRFENRIGLIKNPHRSAAFTVLKAAEVPAVLLELGYLSNPEDEKQMTDLAWQAQLAREVAEAVKGFFAGRMR